MSVLGNKDQNIANKKEITELVQLLRQNGDKVLSASSKLALSTTLLHNLNEEFSLIVDETDDLESSFQVCNSSKIDIFRDLKFLHDFVQKTVGLKVIQSSEDIVHVDITKFRHLKYLELRKVSVTSVKGIQGVRGHLESVICTGKRSVSSIDQLLAACGGDAGVGFTWGSLKHLALPHNALKQLDISLELTPWLQILDLSHNLIVTANELQCLPNLKYVNLSYNKLETIPTFNRAAWHSLQVLVLKNNYIDDISGLQSLECLTELDLSFNCLTEHSSLWPLERMYALLWISLKGNPLSYHPKHRQLTIKHLHPSLSLYKIVLDQLPLSKSEKVLLSENRVNSLAVKHSASVENLTPLSDSVNSSTVSMPDKDILIKNQSLELSSSMEKSMTKSKRKSNVKEAIITEDEHIKDEFKNEIDVMSSSYLETSMEHLETKKQILALRQKFGENNWLSSHAGTFIQDIMGLQSDSNSLTSTSSSRDVHDQLIGLMDSSTTLNEQTSKNLDNDNVESIQKEEILENEHDNEDTSNSTLTELIINEPTEAYDPEEETGDLYLVQKKKNADEMEELFLVITAENIKERDSLTGKVKYCWSINSVLSCVLGRNDPVTVDIIFDTLRIDRQERRYFAELDDAKKIVATLNKKINERPIMLKVFKCMKCSTHFSQDLDNHFSHNIDMTITIISGAKQLKCPTCESTLVIQTDESLRPDGENEQPKASLNLSKDQVEMPKRTDLQHSDSHSSIGSATSLEESRESTPSASALKRYESDIEILSNPSQSSIEVLDETTRANLTPSRKRSSEERRTAAAPSLLTIPDATAITTGLTESSSSGSLTDSICTAYENKVVEQPNSAGKSVQINNEKETIVTNLTSMLGGLLQSIKIGSTKTNLMLKSEEESNFFNNDVQYSYVDFSSVDHRIKLHIILNIFEYENEELVLLLRADIITQTSHEAFPGCLVLSTSKVYVLRIDGSEGEDPQRWLRKENSWTMDRLRSFAPLPFKQGVLVELQQPRVGEEHINIMFLCILQDFQKTSNFLYYLTDLQLPASCEVEFSVPEHCTALMHKLLSNTKNHQDKNSKNDRDSARLLALVSSAVIKYEDVIVQLKLSGLIITTSSLLILKDNMEWLLPCSSEVPSVVKEQSMSNLIEIEHQSTSLTMNFLDEVLGVEESWLLEFSSTGAIEAVINSVRPPWEELFSVPLQVTNRSCDVEKTT